MWQECAMSRTEEGLEKAISEIKKVKLDFWRNLKVTGTSHQLNPDLENALRMADFIELSELMCTDALKGEESCGAHFREEYQSSDGEALRNDERYSYVSNWKNINGTFNLIKEELTFENVKPTKRSYK